jgi:hypothetical protein
MKFDRDQIAGDVIKKQHVTTDCCFSSILRNETSPWKYRIVMMTSSSIGFGAIFRFMNELYNRSDIRYKGLQGALVIDIL